MDERLLRALQAGTEASALGDMPQENIVKSMLGKTWDNINLARDVYEGNVDPLSDEGIGRALDLAGSGFTGGIGRAALSKAIPEQELGIFAGPRAQNAPSKALYDAFAMKHNNAPPDAIWKRTGWFELPDKNWAWEISDDLYKLHPNPQGTARLATEAMEHGELLNAYPNMEDMYITRKPMGGGALGYSMAPEKMYTEPGTGNPASYKYGRINLQPDVEVPKGWDVADTSHST